MSPRVPRTVNHIATPTPFTERSDAVLGFRNIEGRIAGSADVGVTGVFGEVRYTIPVPVLGLSLKALGGPASSADELLIMDVGFAGDREGNATLSRGGALLAVGIGRGGAGVDKAYECGCRKPCDGTRRRLEGILDGPVLEEREGRTSLDGIRRLPCDCGRRNGRGTVALRGVDGAGDGSLLEGEFKKMMCEFGSLTFKMSSLAGVFFELCGPRLVLSWW